LEYWSRTEIQILIADSSVIKYKGQILDNVNYFHYPHKSYLDKLVVVLNKVESEYCTLCADDDFLTLTGLKNCVDFLDHNSDYVCASGKVINFEKKADSLYRWSWSYLKGKSIDHNNPIDRFINHFKHYEFPTYYCVTRVDILYYIWETTKAWNDPDEFRFGEVLPTLLTVLKGKFCLLDFFYAAREIIPNSTNRSIPYIPSYFADGSFYRRYNKFKVCLIEELKKVENMSEMEAGALVDKCMNDYMLNQHLHSIKFLKLKSYIKFILDRLGLLSILKKIMVNRNYKIFLPITIEYNNPANSQYQEFLKISKIVKKYNI